MTNYEADTVPDSGVAGVWTIADDDAPSGTRRINTVTTFHLGEQIMGTPWIVVRSLGAGGVGEVFEVQHALLGRRAAFKVLHQDNLFRHGLAERMASEGRLLASIKHPHIVDVFDMGTVDGGRPYVVLELLEGRDLRRELNRAGVLSIPAALDVVMQVLQGLSALHEAGIVHRDIKLENLFSCSDGHVEIIDFGAAERMGGPAVDRVPSLGTPRTMAPEQYEGKAVDGRADLYALGIVLYELIAGRGPFDDVAGLEALKFAHCERIPPPPSRFAPQFIPPEIDAIVLRALAKSPRDRFASADVMAMEIAAIRTDAPRDESSAVDDGIGQSLTQTTVRSVSSSRLRARSIRVGAGSLADSTPPWGLALVVWMLTILSVTFGVVASRLLSLVPAIDL